MASKVKRKDHLPPTSLPSFRGHPCTAPTTVVTEPAMMPRLAPLLFILSVLFLSHWSTSGEADGVVPDGIRIPEPFDHEVITSRKLGDMTLDYDYGGSNRKHDPPKGKPPGIGSKGP